MALKDPSQLALLSKLMKKRGSKYRNTRMTVDGHNFDSTREAERYKWLRAREQTAQIYGLVLQQRIKIEVNGVHICDYDCDFVYTEKHGISIFEDVKPKFKTKESERAYKSTAAYRLFTIKKKLLKATRGIEVREV